MSNYTIIAGSLSPRIYQTISNLLPSNNTYKNKMFGMMEIPSNLNVDNYLIQIHCGYTDYYRLDKWLNLSFKNIFLLVNSDNPHGLKKYIENSEWVKLEKYDTYFYEYETKNKDEFLNYKNDIIYGDLEFNKMLNRKILIEELTNEN